MITTSTMHLIVSRSLLLLLSISLCPDQALAQLGDGAGDLLTGPMNSMPCVHKLIPCQPYLNSPDEQPPASCCAPLKEMLTNQQECVCSVFNDTSLLKSLNVTQDQALLLPKLCGSQDLADISVCTKFSSTPSDSPVGQSASAKPSDNSDDDDSTGSQSSASRRLTLSSADLLTAAALLFTVTVFQNS